MKLSIITAVYNNETHIATAIESVLNQTYKDVEYIIIDGGSKDGTMDVVNRYKSKISKIVSERDKGIYDALNKGVKLATGDVIGFVHSDDLLASPTTLETIVRYLQESNAHGVYGDLQYVEKQNPDNIVRYWKSNQFRSGQLRRGWMPPHPTLYLRRDVYEQVGLYNVDYRIAADYDFILRCFSQRYWFFKYVPEVLVKMRVGGKSNSVKNLVNKSKEDYFALRRNNVGGLQTLFIKNVSKIPQFLRRK